MSDEQWPEDKAPIEVFTDGGLPFLGAVQERNLPFIIPISLLATARKRPTAMALNTGS